MGKKMDITDKTSQILQTHAGLIMSVVQCTQNPEIRSQLDIALKRSAQNGWESLVATVTKILNGSREESLLNNLDDEDKIVVTAILKGIQDPSTLPKPDEQANATMAAPMLAKLVSEASRGDHNAVIMLGGMADQMNAAGGDMASVGAVLKSLIDGERDNDKLCSRVGQQGESLITAILDELSKLDIH